MKHFTLEDWADFARNTASRNRTDRMKFHLDSGCSRCHSIAKIWSSVSELAGTESAYEPPSQVVRLVKAEFRGRESRPSLVKTLLPARLIFDSLIHPLPAGFRSAASAARQAVYHWEPWLIDMKLESEPGGQVCVTGQIQDSDNPGKSVTGACVALVLDGQRLAETHTNALGEFQLQFDQGVSPLLWIDLQDQAIVVVTLPTEPRASASGPPDSEA